MGSGNADIYSVFLQKRKPQSSFFKDFLRKLQLNDDITTHNRQ